MQGALYKQLTGNPVPTGLYPDACADPADFPGGVIPAGSVV
jgi:hypothetical protein